jgi:hypothetical protein
VSPREKERGEKNWLFFFPCRLKAAKWVILLHHATLGKMPKFSGWYGKIVLGGSSLFQRRELQTNEIWNCKLYYIKCTKLSTQYNSIAIAIYTAAVPRSWYDAHITGMACLGFWVVVVFIRWPLLEKFCYNNKRAYKGIQVQHRKPTIVRFDFDVAVSIPID